MKSNWKNSISIYGLWDFEGVIMPEYTNTEMFNLIDDYIHHARDRRVMKDRLINGYGIEALAEKSFLWTFSGKSEKNNPYK